LAEQGRVDELIEQVVYHWQPSRKETAWKLIGELGCNLIKWEKNDFQRAKLLKLLLSEGQNAPASADIGGLYLGAAKEMAAPEFIQTQPADGSLLVRAEKIFFRMGACQRGLYISAGPIECGLRAAGAMGIYFANDDVFLGPGTVVVCDGEFKGMASNSLIIARKGVTYWNVGNSVILSGGPVRSANKGPAIANSTIISASTVEVPKGAKVINTFIKEHQPDALGLIKFFDPAQVGIQVEEAQDTVRIKKLDAGKMFAKAGLQAGDLVLAMDMAPVPSVAAFRKMLRHSLAGQKSLLFDVQRAGNTLTISVLNKAEPTPKK
jgi:hypothetical protein